jgi:4,5-dihydroxyphthalate decarboxylase
MSGIDGRAQHMTDLPLTLTAADYARLMPLVSGAVKPAGIDLTLLLGREGSWPMRAEMLRRAGGDPAVHGGESSMAGHLRRIEAGDRSLVALPVFPLRNFTGRDLYVRKGGAVRTPADLRGKRVGVYDWVASGSIWYRHFLNFIGVLPADLHWTVGEVDGARITNHAYTLPEGIRAAARPLSEMLINGELDAIYSPPRPHRYHPVDGPIVRLFPDIRGIERDYFRRSGMFPPQHLIVLKRPVWEAHKWIARSLTDAFIRATDVFAKAQRNFPYVSPWLEAELEETEALMGADFHADGFEKNRATIEVFSEQARALGIISRRITAEEYFAEYLDSPERGGAP